MDDDFNTPEAIAVLFDAARELNRVRRTDDQTQISALASVVKKLGSHLGLLERNADAFLKGGVGQALSESDIYKMIDDRQTAKQNKDWTEADRIRDGVIRAGSWENRRVATVMGPTPPGTGVIQPAR